MEREILEVDLLIVGGGPAASRVCWTAKLTLERTRAKVATQRRWPGVCCGPPRLAHALSQGPLVVW